MGHGPHRSNRARWWEYVRLPRWMPGQVLRMLDAMRTAHALVLDTGTFCTIGEHVWRAAAARIFSAAATDGTSGWAFPHALAARGATRTADLLRAR